MYVAKNRLIVRVVCILSLVFFHGCVWAGITFEQSVKNYELNSTTNVSPTITGATNNLYILFITVRGSRTVNSVVGGSLTWTLQKNQCSGRNQNSARIYTAYGSPSNFTVTVTFSTASESTIILARYSSTDGGAVEDAVGENTNGENGACSGGTDNADAQLTTGSTVANSAHIVCITTRGKTVANPDTDYTLRDSDTQGDGIYFYEYIKAATGDDTYSHINGTLSASVDWATAGLVIKAPAAAGAAKRGQTIIITGEW